MDGSDALVDAGRRTLLVCEGITQRIIGAAIEVHRALRPGLLESTYEACLARELADRGVSFQRQVELPVLYKSERIECGYRLDLLVEKLVIVELKSVEKVLPIHEAQLLTYLRLSGLTVGLILNFNVRALKHGIVRRVNTMRTQQSPAEPANPP